MRELLESLEEIGRILTRLGESSKEGDLEDSCRLFQRVSEKCTPRMIDAWKCRSETELTQILEEIKLVLVQRLLGLLQTDSAVLSTSIDETMGSAFKVLSLFVMVGEQERGLANLADLVGKFAASSLASIVNAQCTQLFKH